MRSKVGLLAALLLLGGEARPAAAQGAGEAPPARPLILLSNDDGYSAPGLQALVRAFAGRAELYVAAPLQNQSGKGHSITISEPVWIHERQEPGVAAAYAIEATPATSARLGLDKLVPRRPDLVISGINRGENLGSSVYLSGTLGAAREAAFDRIPAIAVSMQGDAGPDYARTADYVRALVDELRAGGLLRDGMFLNVNAPRGEPRGVRVTRLSVKPSRQIFVRAETPRGRVLYWTDYEQLREDAEGTDVSAFFQGFVTLTPLTLDASEPGALEPLRRLEQKPAKAAAR